MKILLSMLMAMTLAAVSSAATLVVPAPAPPDEYLPMQFIQVQPAPPADRAWYSPGNLSIAAGASYRWWRALDPNALDPKKEFVFGLYNAWQLTQHVDAIGNVEYGVDTKATGFTVGVRVILKMPD